MDSPPLDAPGTVGIVEVVNSTRREIFIAVSGAPADAFRLPQSVLSRWRMDDDLEFRRVACAMPPDDAQRFLSIYLTKVDRPGWTVLVD